MPLLNKHTHLDIYLNLNCNLRCKHCFVGKELDKRVNFELKSIFKLLEFSRSEGVEKISLLGGEPTIYPYILEVLHKAEKLNFKQIRIVTNGTKPLTKILKLYSASKFKPDIIFSIDAVNKETYDKIRGRNTFEKLLYNIELANKLNFKIAGIASINKINQTEVNGILDFAQQSKMRYLNFHSVNNRGFADSNIVLSPEIWLNIRQEVIEKSKTLSYPIKFDRKFIEVKEFKTLPPFYDECFVNEEQDGNIMILPDGRVYKCALFIDNNSLNSHVWNGNDIVSNFNDGEAKICSNKCVGQCPGLNTFSSNLYNKDKFQTICMYRKEIIENGDVYLEMPSKKELLPSNK